MQRLTQIVLCVAGLVVEDVAQECFGELDPGDRWNELVAATEDEFRNQGQDPGRGAFTHTAYTDPKLKLCGILNNGKYYCETLERETVLVKDLPALASAFYARYRARRNP